MGDDARMTLPHWEEIPLDRYDDYWGPFAQRFGFAPAHGIDEPAPSVTIDLAPIFDAGQARFNAGERAVNALAVLAMTGAFPPDQRLLVLDWQHPCRWFWPHRQVLQPEPLWWLVFPNGDYHAVVTADLSTGTFGHPWEQTLCVFGRPLLDTLVPMLTSWLPIKRESAAAS
jgi:hypothetical protein